MRAVWIGAVAVTGLLAAAACSDGGEGAAVPDNTLKTLDSGSQGGNASGSDCGGSAAPGDCGEGPDGGGPPAAKRTDAGQTGSDARSNGGSDAGQGDGSGARRSGRECSQGAGGCGIPTQSGPGALLIAKSDGTTTVGQDDADGDGWYDVDDNCPGVPNADQQDSDEDRIGDACDDSP